MTKKARRASRPSKMRKAAPKSAKPASTARDQKILQRMYDTGNFPQALEKMQSIMFEIDRTPSGGPSLKLGEQAMRMALAKRAFEDAILTSDDLNAWIEAARKAGQLT